MPCWPSSSSMMSSVRCARTSADVNATSKRKPCAFSLRPAARASAMPCSLKSMSRHPVNRFLRFHSLWPWRTSTRRRSGMGSSTAGVSEILQAEHVGHGVQTRRLAAGPQRGLDRAAGIDAAVLGTVYELDALAGRGKDHAVIADHAAAAQRGKTDIALASRAGDAVAPRNLALGEIHSPALRGRGAEQERGPGRRIDLLVVMHFENLDVEFVIETRSDPAHQRGHEIHAHTHVGRAHDHRLASEVVDLFLVRGGK